MPTVVWVWAVLTLPAFLSGAAGQPPPGQRAVSDAAGKRQESVKTLDIRFKQWDVVAAGVISEDAPPLPLLKPKGPVPEKATTLESINRWIIDGHRIRYEDNHPNWHLPSGNLIKRTEISLFNGSTAKIFYPNGFSGQEGPAAGLPSTSQLPQFASLLLTPITFTFRALTPDFSNWLQEMKPTGVTQTINGAPCQEYVLKSTRSLWLDPAQDYVVRRLSLQKKGQMVDQIDITYRPHEIAGWVPISWVHVQRGPSGAVRRTTTINILEIRVNDPQPPEQFDVVFPPGTTVIDSRNVAVHGDSYDSDYVQTP
jgi:hypothetical protein